MQWNVERWNEIVERWNGMVDRWNTGVVEREIDDPVPFLLDCE